MQDLLIQGTDVFSVVTQAFGPNGESLIDDEAAFDGEHGIKLYCRQTVDGKTIEGFVTISPFQGDKRKIASAPFVEGKKIEIMTPKEHVMLDVIPKLRAPTGAEFVAIYLTKKLQNGEAIAVTNVWGDLESEVLDEDTWLARLIEE